MPNYEYYCGRCGIHMDVIRMVRNRDDELICICGVKMMRRISVPTFRFFKPYFNQGLGKVVETPSEQREVDKKPLFESDIPYDPVRAKIGLGGKIPDEDKRIMIYNK